MTPATPYLTAKQAASYLCLSYSHFKALQAAHRTPARRIGRKVIYRRDWLDRWVESGIRPRNVKPRSTKGPTSSHSPSPNNHQTLGA